MFISIKTYYLSVSKAKLPFLALLPLLLLVSPMLSAQFNTAEKQFHKVTNGLSQSSITDILEDSEGYLWLGTQNGLHKYDGTDFETFEKGQINSSGLTNGYIESLYEDANDLLYIGTAVGLNIYNKQLGHIEPYPFIKNQEKISSQHITAILKSDNQLLLGTYGDGVKAYNTNSGEVQELKFDNFEENHISALYKIGDNHYLAISIQGLTLFNSSLEIIATKKANPTIKSVTRKNNGEVITGLENGEIVTYTISKNIITERHRKMISEGYGILSILEDDASTIWVGTENKGAYVYSEPTDQLSCLNSTKAGLDKIHANSIWSMYKDSKGGIWLGVFKHGLYFHNPEYHKFLHVKHYPFESNTLTGNIVNCFYEQPNGDIWIGTDGGGLDIWDASSSKFKNYSLDNEQLNTNVILSLLKADNNKIWAGSWGKGITIIDIETKKYEVLNSKNSFLLSDNVLRMHQDTSGLIWIASMYGGLQVYDPVTDTYETLEIPYSINGAIVAKTIRSIYEDTNGNIWLGTQNYGLIRANKQNNKWVYKAYNNLVTTAELSDNFINAITEDSNGTLWIGTLTGLNRYDRKTDKFILVTDSGLETENITGILEDNTSKLWLSTNNGIASYDLNTNVVDRYGVDDGLQGTSYNANATLKTSTNQLIFAGSNGFNLFNPEEVTKRGDMPQVNITDLQIANESVAVDDQLGILKQHISQTDSIKLNYNQNKIDFEFNALSFLHPERINYAYYLEGFETEWNYVGDKKNGTYTNLDAGNYTLHIKSSNSDGVWNAQEKTLHIAISPPYWKTLWFQLGILILLFGGIYGVHAFRIRSIKKYQITLQEKIEERTTELMDKTEKLKTKNEEIQRFAYAVSHDLKSPLSGIKGIASLIPMEFVMQDFPGLEEYLDMINISCDTMTSLISDITRIAKLGKIENKYEIYESKELIDIAITLVEGKLKTANVKLEVAKDLPVLFCDKNRMIQVFGNLIDNAIKYMGAQENPLITIAVTQKEDDIAFQVTDNGSGMTEEQLNKLFTPFERFHENTTGTGLGLYMVRQIVESHIGTINASSEGKDKGTTFTVKLPSLVKMQELSIKNLVDTA